MGSPLPGGARAVPFEAARLLKGTPETYGDACAPYLLAILDEQGVNSLRLDEQGGGQVATLKIRDGLAAVLAPPADDDEED